MSTSLSAIQGITHTHRELVTVMREEASVTSLLSSVGIILGLVGCLIGIVASLPALAIVSVFVLGISIYLLITNVFLHKRHLIEKSLIKSLPSPTPSEDVPEVLEQEAPESPKPLKGTIAETLLNWNRIDSSSLFPYFLSSDRILLFRNPSARFKAWNMPGTRTLFISTSGPAASLRIQSELPAAVVNGTHSASCEQGGRGVNDLFSVVLTDKCWERSKPKSGILLPGECSSTAWEDNYSIVPQWDSQTSTYNKPVLFMQAYAPKASCYANNVDYCYYHCCRAYINCFEKALNQGCHIIQTPLLASFPDFVPQEERKRRRWMEAAKLALLHAVEIISSKHPSKDIVIVLTDVPQPIPF
ncbi:hypothetical protein [Chlamydia sp.]|uniref:hypothetical protein n=1 Tax=Chlamydia sp. TaxID=35827 RepID=UPI0025C5E412|nr:hypothetical protein [Chlamydia sp.]MBQ8498420.1 hypothetical protein [Chlamydia sp.]